VHGVSTRAADDLVKAMACAAEIRRQSPELPERVRAGVSVVQADVRQRYYRHRLWYQRDRGTAPGRLRRHGTGIRGGNSEEACPRVVRHVPCPAPARTRSMTRFPLAAPADLNSKAKDMALPGPSIRGRSTTSPGWQRDGRHRVRREDGALRIRGASRRSGRSRRQGHSKVDVLTCGTLSLRPAERAGVFAVNAPRIGWTGTA
jgi:hypothetical protein